MKKTNPKKRDEQARGAQDEKIVQEELSMEAEIRTTEKAHEARDDLPARSAMPHF
jgi:hypothetical protein